MIGLAQISVTATAGNSGPSNYTNLRLAFAAVNDGTHQGAITIDIISSPSADNNTAVLNASGSGSASYTSVLVQPEGSTGSRSIIGTVNGGPLVDLNGADNVTIDGRTGDGFTLTVSNQSSASTGNTSTIRFVNDACDNTVRNCNILGRSTGSPGTLSGNVVFGAGSITGNDDNVIRSCTIANDGDSDTYLMTQAITSSGTTTSLALHNSGNMVDSCLIHDFHGTSGARGIHLSNGNHAWMLTNNHLFQRAPRTDAAGLAQFIAMDIQSTHADAGGHLVHGNHVGGADTAALGVWTLSGGNNRFCGVLLNVSQTAPLNLITGNTITGIAQTTGVAHTTSLPACALINVQSGAAGITHNTIGSLDASDAVHLTASSGWSQVVGILSAGEHRHIRHNTIGGLTLVAEQATVFGIRDRLATGVAVCDSNTVGGALGPLRCVPVVDTPAWVVGVQAAGDTTWLRGNMIGSLLADGNGSSSAYGVQASGAGHVEIRGNTLEHLDAITAMGVYTIDRTVRAEDNTITDLGSSGTTANRGTCGIRVDNGTAVLRHNRIADLTTAYTGLSGYAMGIRLMNGALVADSNTVFNVTGPQAIGLYAHRSPASCTGNTVQGVLGNATSGSHTVYALYAVDSAFTAVSNTLSGIANGSTGATHGISVSGGVATLQGNRVMGVHGHSTAGSGLAGILVINSAATKASVVRNNTVHTVHSLQSSTNAHPRGIWLQLPTASNVVEGNALYAIWSHSTGTGSTHAGIHLTAGTSTIRNNMVQLGLDSAGASVASDHIMRGIHVAVGEHAILHNSVYIGGTVTTSGSNHTYALLSSPTGTRDHRNNILWNARSNGAGSAKHYAVGVNASLTGLVSDHNCLYVTGTGGHVGREGTTDRSTLSAWQSATSLDGNSISVDPGFVNVTGPADEVDLHIQHNSAGAAALDGAGATGTAVLFDYDGATRLSPPDIGADEILLVLPDFYEEPLNSNLTFWKNKGQVADTDRNPRPDVGFYGDVGTVWPYLRKGSTFSLVAALRDTSVAATDTSWRVDVSLTGGKVRSVDPMGWDATPYHRNYYYPWCGPEGATGVRGHGRVVYEEVYPYTDLHFYSGSGGPKMAFVVRPGGDHADIQLTFDGQDSLTVDGLGVLVAHMNGWSFPLVGGIAYQVDGTGNILPVSMVAYLNSAGSAVVDIALSFSSAYDPDLPLVIQVSPPPSAGGGGGGGDLRNLGWSTYVGGSGGDHLSSVEVDNEGDPYVCGGTWAPDFPVDPGTAFYPPFEENFYGMSNAVVMKFSAGNKQIRWATFYGGSTPIGSEGPKTKAYKLAVYTKFNPNLQYVFVTGSTNAIDFREFARPTTIFDGAVNESYQGGIRRMWVGAFRKEDGRRDWATTHGAAEGDDWSEDGLSIAVDFGGRVAVGGQLREEGLSTLDFPSVTPAGTFNRAEGGGFVMLFDNQYQIAWSTTFGSLWYYTRVNDILFHRIGEEQELWLVGGTNGGLDLAAPPSGGYYQTSYANTMAMVACFDLTDGSLAYSTYWGGTNNEDATTAMGITSTEKSIWVVGYTSSAELTTTECPDPGGTGVHHSSAHQGFDAGFNKSDGFILLFDPTTRALKYGTLIGGVKDDLLYDVTHDEGTVYITGESRSVTGFAGDLDTDWYYQPPTGNGNMRDAVMLRLLDDHQSPTLLWRTSYGGEQSERGWGIAASDQELFVVGSTGSNYWEGFPLLEWNQSSPLDYFQEYNLGGEDYGFVPWYQFEYPLDYEHSGFGEAGLEPSMQAHDGFIASFAIPALPVSVQPSSRTQNDLSVIPTAPYEWLVTLSDASAWNLSVFDATGRLVRSLPATGTSVVLDLSNEATGIYLLQAHSLERGKHHAKIFRP